MLMENCKYTSVPSVKSEQKPVFGGLGTWLNMTKAGWFAKTLWNIVFLFFPFSYFSTWKYFFCDNSSTTKKCFPLSFHALTVCSVSSGCLQGPPSRSCWTQSMELRWTIGCRSRKLCLGNVCLCDWTVPWVYVNWAPCNHTQARMTCVCSPAKGGWDYPLAWMFHSETVIEMDFCLLSHSDRLWFTKLFTNMYYMTNPSNFLAALLLALMHASSRALGMALFLPC